jgi:thiamine-monophosphate kinase
VTTIAGSGELRLLELIAPYLAPQAGGDDAAVVDAVGPFTVVSTDMAVEGVHFDLTWMSAEDAGWRALALALGDLAAKGASPAWALTSLAVPRTWDVDNFVGLFSGMHQLAIKNGIAIEGGDMSAIDGPAVLSITVAGRAAKEPLPRSAAKAGWAVLVTGPLGGSAVALRERRVLRLEPRLAQGRWLNEAGLCCGDVSDGLVREMEKFEAMAGVGCVLNAGAVPVADGATMTDALTSGEEVELVCVGPEEVAKSTGLPVVGVLTRERGVRIEGAGVDVRRHGYDHFA